jgi:hypothetical protein
MELTAEQFDSLLHALKEIYRIGWWIASEQDHLSAMMNSPVDIAIFAALRHHRRHHCALRHRSN